jgi:hypothetical protein
MWTEYINRSQTHECGNWGRDRLIPFLGIHKWDFRCSEGQYICLFVLNLLFKTFDFLKEFATPSGATDTSRKQNHAFCLWNWLQPPPPPSAQLTQPGWLPSFPHTYSLFFLFGS